MDDDILEEIASLRIHPGWIALSARYRDALTDIEMSALSSIDTKEQLWKAKGWREAVLELLDEPEAARAILDEVELPDG